MADVLNPTVLKVTGMWPCFSFPYNTQHTSLLSSDIYQLKNSNLIKKKQSGAFFLKKKSDSFQRLGIFLR